MTAHQAAYELEQFLGDPRERGSRMSFHTQMSFDEREAPALPAIAALKEWGFPAHLVPPDAGGRLRSAEELLYICRSLARRDLSLTVSYGTTMLTALPVWNWGDDGQRARMGELIKAGGFGGFGLTERAHGSDLLASDLVAEPGPDGDGFLVTGSKWPINNATRGSVATLFARTGSGPRGYSLLLLDKERSATDRWHNEPRVPTMGLRGCDFSGLTFDRTPFAADTVIGGRGRGLEKILKTLQITRSLIAPLSLGAADTAVRVALEHACHRRLYGSTAFAIPVIRQQLMSAYLDLLIAECVALPTARAFSLAPARLSVWSAVTKYVVPVLADEIIHNAGAVLGSRHFLREDVADGIFQKVKRDHSIVSVFDGTTHVNLQVVASQLPSLAWSQAPHAARSSDMVPMAELFSRSEQVSWNPRQPGLRLTNDGRDEITQSWERAAATVTRLCSDAAGGLTHAAAQDLADAVGAVDKLWQRQQADIQQTLSEEDNLHSSARGFELARRHCLLHAAACCVHTWLANRQQPGTFISTGEWLVLCLHRILDRLEPVLRGESPHSAVVEREMLRCLTENRLLSLTPFRLGGAPS